MGDGLRIRWRAALGMHRRRCGLCDRETWGGACVFRRRGRCRLRDWLCLLDAGGDTVAGTLVACSVVARDGARWLGDPGTRLACCSAVASRAAQAAGLAGNSL